MNVEDLLLSTQSLMRLQEAQVKAEGREFTAHDAMLAARPALESVLSEVLDLQRKGGTGPQTCHACGVNLQPTVADVYDDYDNADAQDIIDTLDELHGEEIRVLHEHEKATQKRGSVLSAMTTAYSNATAGLKLDEEQKKEQDDQTGKVLDKMFADLFKGQS